jgi:sodium transport system permease protein
MFMQEHPTRVLLIGRGELPDSPALVDGERFAAGLFGDEGGSRLLKLHFPAENGGAGGPSDWLITAREALQDGQYDAVVYFAPGFLQRLEAFRSNLDMSPDEGSAPQEVPGPEILYSTARRKSQVTYRRVTEVLQAWRQEIGKDNLVREGIAPVAIRPFLLKPQDVARQQGHRDAAVWSTLLPFMLLVWALTGAFYPAIDLCAGEKERGTLETLLSSPAERTEIVWGKLLTIMCFSVATVVLNIASLALTGLVVSRHLPQTIGLPPALAPLWLLLALLPVSAFFSALCLALAAFARSTKEGQYYLMPLILITMPLVILSMSDSVELDLGNSLIPITGIVLLLRAALEGNYHQAVMFTPAVLAVTCAGCWLAIRWAVDQFNSENVLFRESERLDVGLWLKHLRLDRQDTPTVGEAACCAMLILVIRFFMSFTAPPPGSLGDFYVLAVVTQLVVIGTPVLLMTVMLTRSPGKTLLLRKPRWAALPAAVALAVALHPAVNLLREVVQWLYPINEELFADLARMLGEADNIWLLLLVLAVLPAVFEELAFRGFILSGLRHLGHTRRAIVLSSLLFGVTHAIFQQSIVATIVGVAIGYIAVQTGSIWPGMLFHLVHNSLALGTSNLTPELVERNAVLAWLTRPAEGGYSYSWEAILLGCIVAGVLLVWFRRLPYVKTSEEALQDAIEHKRAQPVAG